MNALSVENLEKNFGERQLFSGLNFGLDEGQKVALVGVNGCGKSTLLRILAGEETADGGRFSFNKQIKVVYLEQEPLLLDHDTVWSAIFQSSDPAVQLLKDYIHLIEKQLHSEAESEQLQELIHAIDNQHLWDYEQKIKQILGTLGIDQLDQPISELSGGQKKRVALARALVSRPDFLMLDEPTNHLDLDVIEWLERYLSTERMSVLMVTHDRYFLENVCQEIFEMEQGKLYRHKGKYAEFLENKALRETQQSVEAEKARNLLRKELEWMRRQPKARGTKSKARIENFYKLKDKAGSVQEKDGLQLEVTQRRLGGKVLELAYLHKQFGEQCVLDNFSYIFTRHDRIGIVGKNGVGKSSFLNMLTGRLRPDGGGIEKGENTVIGYYTQAELRYKADQLVIDLVKEQAEYIKLSDGKEVSASQFLQRFLFPPRQQHDYVAKLSGGEKRRLQLLLVLMKNPNFLILDEPTNDLDLATLNILEEFLEQFSGCLVLVSHDRYFMDRLVDHLFIFEGAGKVRDFPGNYTDYREQLKLEKNKVEPVVEIEKAVEKPIETNKTTATSRKLSFNEKRELEQINLEMPRLQAEISRLENLLSTAQGSAEDFTQWGDQLHKLQEQLDALELRWLELSA